MNIVMLIVVHNKKLDKSITYQCINNSNYKICIVDNNTNEEIINYNKEFVKNKDLIFLTKNKNLGLSKAYNLALSELKTMYPDYLVLFDDDTHISNEYLTLLQTFAFEPKTLYAPLIYNLDGKLINPSYHHPNYLIEYFKNKKYRIVDDIKPLIGNKHLFAINSGLIIPFDFFNEFRYNEDIFLDFVDHYCCSQCYKLCYKVDIFPCRIEQNFSVDNIANQSFENNAQRLCIKLHDSKIYNKTSFIVNKLIFILLYTLKTKDFRYLKYLFKRF